MASHKLKVFIPVSNGERVYQGYPALETIVSSQLDLVTAEELVANPSLGADIKVGFYCGGPTGALNFEYKEQGLLPNLELVCNHGAGVDHIPTDRMRELGLRLTNTPKVLSDSGADLAMALMLSSGRLFKTGMDIAMRTATENKRTRFRELLLGQEISSMVLGIVGMGSIGYKVAERAKAFNMTILYHSRKQRSSKDEGVVGATYYADLLSMLPLCDYVVISCPLSAQTKGLFSTKEFKAMKTSAHLINVARGPIVNTDSLVEALRSKEIDAAALDVTDPEPLPDDHPLLSLENVIVIPHWGSATVQTRGKMIQLMIDNARAFLEGKPLLSEVKF